MTGLLGSTVSAADKRAKLRSGLNSGQLQRYPGAFSPLVAKLVAEIGFEGIYVSGAVLSADLGLPDIGLTTLSEVAGRSAQIAAATDLPTLVDADTGQRITDTDHYIAAGPAASPELRARLERSSQAPVSAPLQTAESTPLSPATGIV